ncbi:MAG: ATP-binding cassette domain-containing protein [Planctomycetes bacterium]|nr:ATP-binding cassette domain-containing protein [Planctomycetota bacterium]
MENYSQIPLYQLIKEFPFVESFLESVNIDISTEESQNYTEILQKVSLDWYEDHGTSAEKLIDSLNEHISQMLSFLGEKDERISTLTIFPGFDKSAQKESYTSLTLKSGEITSIVGPTGSGKSRLLADIEWVSQGDTPTKRVVHLNDQEPDPKWRYSPMHKLVAQLSQNMNFVMDVEVEEFLFMHAESRMINNADDVVKAIIDQANELAGESFSGQTALTGLSGGQSRSLMIADTAILSRSPIVLIDEIENAGIDRRKALDLLVSEDKIVLMATHDPILALMGTQRLVIGNGGIRQVIKTSQEERGLLDELMALDSRLQDYRNRLRTGEILI